jgi:DNA-binding LacI/PurR family transcriptional regulator
VRDQHYDVFMPQAVRRFHHHVFGQVLERAGDFIQNQKLQIMIQPSDNTYALVLPTLKERIALDYDGLVLMGRFTGDRCWMLIISEYRCKL